MLKYLNEICIPNFMERKLVWMPYGLYQPTHDFGILLNPGFAKETYRSKLPEEKRTKFQKLASELIKGEKYHELNPFIFHEDSYFVRQINIDAGNGKWLAVDGLYGRKPDFRHIISYSSHNLDTIFDQSYLTRLFDMWVEHAEILKGP